LIELSDSQKHGALFVGAFIVAGIVISTMVFPFWNLIREDVFEEVEIISSTEGVCYADTSDIIPKTIKNCDLESGTFVTIKYGEGLAWATIVEP